MVSIPVYLRLWRLKASNQNLLKVYYAIYYEASGEEAPFYRREFSQRIHRREKINRELEICIRESQSMEGNSNLSKIIDLIFPTLFSIEYLIQKMFFPHDIDECQAFEIKNIEMYYEFLYSGCLPEEITALLLDQKSEIEDSAYIEI